MIEDKILFEDSHYIAIDKPPKYHVHPPENSQWRVSKELICLYQVRDYLNHYVYPIHRLDAPTGGVLLFGKNSEAAGKIQELIQLQKVYKHYLAVARGYTPTQQLLDQPLLSDSSDLLLPSQTYISTLSQVELPFSVAKTHSTTRYSLIRAEPKTGRYHQIRRHLASNSHPLIGDIKHGDSRHNRFFREELKIEGLLLHCFQLRFIHPYKDEIIDIKTNWSKRWQRVFKLFKWEDGSLQTESLL